MSNPERDTAEGRSSPEKDEHARGEIPVPSETAEQCRLVAGLDISRCSLGIDEIDSLVTGRNLAQRPHSVA
jgi:hypothetical protein